MTNDGHDSSVPFAGKSSLDFLEPLLKNDYFMKDTLVLLTFDENDSYNVGNRVFTLLLCGAVPKNMHGTTEDTFYTHYSCIASVSANWGLPTLGRNDVGANVLDLIAQATKYRNKKVDTTGYYANGSAWGYLNSQKWTPSAGPYFGRLQRPSPSTADLEVRLTPVVL
ncbi:putative acid phosphatase [Bifiguratus adelaidae]|uniref:Putative acid phosphatase n=1 Tax=Bifiguratus adelaidae TaxID=1938954 RepID=A0A261XSS2_9FUNG|nr:putative acid phosphatase [Bifiguratus adelaidae]